jgi:hypothetical protein
MDGARRAIASLLALHRWGLVPAVWHPFIVGTFFLDSLERWTQATEKVAEAFGRRGAVTGPDWILAVTLLRNHNQGRRQA